MLLERNMEVDQSVLEPIIVYFSGMNIPFTVYPFTVYPFTNHYGVP